MKRSGRSCLPRPLFLFTESNKASLAAALDRTSDDMFRASAVVIVIGRSFQGRPEV
jgi:hypothetical protein